MPRIATRTCARLQRAIGFFSVALYASSLHGQGGEGAADAALVPVARAVQRGIVADIDRLAEDDFEEWLFAGLTPTAARNLLESLLRLRVDDVCDVCRLADAQKRKLELAGEADIRRLFDDAATLKTKLPLARHGERAFDEFIRDVQLLKLAVEQELVDDRSFFSKTLRKTLTAEQAARYERVDRDRRLPRHKARVESTIDKLEGLLRLRDEQRRTLTQLLLTETRPPPKFGQYDHDVVMLQMARLPEAKVLPIFDEAQWRILNRQLAQVRSVESFLRDGGLLPLVQERAGGDALLAAARRPALAAAPIVPKRQHGPEQVEGPPDTPAGDFVTAWASQTSDGLPEWLVCRYAEAVEVRAVLIRETYNPGAVCKVSAFDEADEEVIVWEGIDPTPRDLPMGISVIPIKVNFQTNKIKVYIDSPAVPGWNEIDAVGLRDAAGETHWARRVEASSTCATPAAPWPPGVFVPAEEWQRLKRLDDEIKELRKRMDRLQRLEAEVEQLKQLLKERRQPEKPGRADD